MLILGIWSARNNSQLGFGSNPSDMSFSYFYQHRHSFNCSSVKSYPIRAKISEFESPACALSGILIAPNNSLKRRFYSVFRELTAQKTQWVFTTKGLSHKYFCRSFARISSKHNLIVELRSAPNNS